MRIKDTDSSGIGRDTESKVVVSETEYRTHTFIYKWYYVSTPSGVTVVGLVTPTSGPETMVRVIRETVLSSGGIRIP